MKCDSGPKAIIFFKQVIATAQKLSIFPHIMSKMLP